MAVQRPRRVSTRRVRRRFVIPPWLAAFMANLERRVIRVWPYLRLPITFLALVHLVLVALLPGGKNVLMGVVPKTAPAYLTMYPSGDMLGFYTPMGKDGFLLYRIYGQDGSMGEGIFPDKNVTPRLRYDRWAMAGDRVSGPHPDLHTLVMGYVLDRLPRHPVRLELYSAHWEWERESLTFPWPGLGPRTTLKLKLLGTYTGFTRTWETVRVEEEPK